MATVNRYTQIQPAQYQERSLQETLMVPQYMREQHSKMEEGKALLESQLAQIDSLDYMSEDVNSKKEEIQNKLNDFAGRLSTQGFDHSSRTDFLDINSKYQAEMGTSGTFGKAQSIKEQFLKDKELAIQNGIKAGMSELEIQNNINKSYQEAKQKYEESKIMENINVRPAPNKYGNTEFIQEAKTILSGSGMTLDEFSEKGYSFNYDQQLGQMVIMQGGSRVSTNDPNLENLAELAKEHFFNPSGKGRLSDDYRGIDPNTRLSKLNSTINAMRNYSKLDNRRFNFVTPSENKNKEKVNVPAGLASHQDQTTPIAKNRKELSKTLTGLKEQFEETQDQSLLSEIREIENIADKSEKEALEFVKTKGYDEDKINDLLDKLGFNTPEEKENYINWRNQTFGEDISQGAATVTGTGTGIGGAMPGMMSGIDFLTPIMKYFIHKNKLNENLSTDEIKELKKQVDLEKQKLDKQDEIINQTGYNRLNVAIDFQKSADNKNFLYSILNLAGQGPDTSKAEDIVSTDKDGKIGKDLIANESDLRSFNTLLNESNFDINRAYFTKTAKTTGYKMQITAKNDLVAGDTDIPKGTSFDVYVPQPPLTDGNYGDSPSKRMLVRLANESPQAANSILMSNYYNFLNPTYSKEKLGETPRLSLDQFNTNYLDQFEGFDKNSSFDLLSTNIKTSRGQNIEGMSLYFVPKDSNSNISKDPEPVTWNKILHENLTDSQKEYAYNNLTNIMVSSLAIYDNNFDFRNASFGDIIKALGNREVKLTDTLHAANIFELMKQ